MARVIQATLENIPSVGKVIQVVAYTDGNPATVGINLSIPEARDLRNRIDLLIKEDDLSKDQK